MSTHASVIALQTIVRKEAGRIFRIWPQTLLPAVITQSLYFVIFGAFLGQRIGEVGGTGYATFLVPGLILMSVVTNAFMNVASSLFSAKFMRNIDEILVAPVSPGVLLAGYCSGGVVRSVLVGSIVFAVSTFFIPSSFAHPWAVVVFGLLTAACFSLFGFLNGLFAKKFDDVSIIPTFVLTPLTYLGGVFYDISSLPPFWQGVARLNPLVYAVDGFRYGFTGISSTPVATSAIILTLVTVVMGAGLLWSLRRGIGLRD